MFLEVKHNVAEKKNVVNGMCGLEFQKQSQFIELFQQGLLHIFCEINLF